VSTIQADVVAEGRRLLGVAAEQGVPLRVLGGVAVCLRAPDGLNPAFERSYQDLDFVTAKKAGGSVEQLLRSEGYEPHVAFNALHGGERLLFFDDPNERQVDVFIGAFSMSHRIPIGERLERDQLSVPLAELLLTKLQIAQLNQKDVCDALAILDTHEVGSDDGETVNGDRIAELCAADWGLWRTITGNMTTVGEHIERYGLEGEAKERVKTRIDAVLERIEDEPKSRAWRLRAKIGERKRWYELPEEVGGGP
jgi:hypothetical protein